MAKKIELLSVIERWEPHTTHNKHSVARCYLKSGHIVFLTDFQVENQLEAWRLDFGLPWMKGDHLHRVMDVLVNMKVPLLWVWRVREYDTQMVGGVDLTYPPKDKA